jgi:hypothetical protein
MKSEITDVIAELVLQTTPDLESRLEDQAEALREVQCVNPLLGRWIDAYDVKYLLSTFALTDKDFAARFPSMAHIAMRERQKVVAAIEEHFDRCPHCYLKRAYDLELDARIKQACQQNNSLLLQLLEEDDAGLPECGEAWGMRLERVLSVNQKP